MFDVGSTLSDYCLQTRCHVLHHFGKRFPRNVPNFSADVFLQLIKSLSPRVSIDHILQIPPQEEVWMSKVRGIRWPLNVVVERDKAALKVLFEKMPCFPGCMGRCPILLEPLGSHLERHECLGEGSSEQCSYECSSRQKVVELIFLNSERPFVSPFPHSLHYDQSSSDHCDPCEGHRWFPHW